MPEQMGSRDPRKDPRPGDVIDVGLCVCFVVNSEHGKVDYVLAGQLQSKVYSMPLFAWIEGSRGAEVLYVAGA